MPQRPRLVLVLAVSAVLVSTHTILNQFLRAQTFQQSPASQSEAQANIRVNSDLVILPVTVKDRHGILVPDLQGNEFRVFDDRVEQTIDVFTAEGFPLSLVILVDDDLKSNDAAQMAPTLGAIMAGISSSDEAIVCRFDLKFYPEGKFTGDTDTLLAQLRDAQDASRPSTAGPVPFVTGPSSHPRGVGEPPLAAPTNLGSAPTKALDDAVFSAAELLHDRERGRRKVILLISDGINGQKFNHHTYEDAIQMLARNDISVYSLAVGSASSNRRFSRLIRYANDSGGDVYYAAMSGTMEKLYSQITEQARHEYTLAYVPRGNDSNSSYHFVEVTTTRQGLRVKTRPGYYSPQGPPAP